MITHYHGSRGPVEIATMPYPHLVNALAKLQRGGDPLRSAEIAAMGAQVAKLDAEHKELSEARGDDEPDPTPPAPAAARVRSAPAGMGDNNPPGETPWEGIRVHLEDLLIEARNWADGAAVETQAQADDISRLIEDMTKGAKAADDARLAEKEDLDKQIQAIQDRYNLYIGGLKSKVKNPGKVVVAIEALKATLKPYLDRLQAEKDAEAKRLADEAAAAAAVAAEAIQAAPVEDLGAREAAEDLVSAAAELAAEAKQAAGDRAHASGGSRAMGLKKTYTPVIKDRKAALLHYAATRPEDLTNFLIGLARQDVAAGKRQIPGFDVVEGTRL